jgi:antitoxin component YwqK of YwqJK toxin-antitoxin module
MFVRLSIWMLVFIAMPVSLLAQQKRVVFFDRNWLLAKTPSHKFYFCEYYPLENDWIHGPFLCFTVKNETLVKQYYFENNKLDGPVSEFYPNGNIKLEAKYYNGVPVGDWKEWNEKGELTVHRSFDDASRVMRNYFADEDSNYRKMMGIGTKKEEAPIFSTECLLIRQDAEKYKCSDQAMKLYYRTPPIPPDAPYKNKTLKTLLKYELSHEALVTQVEIIESSGDDYLDELAEIHILNMTPFESAKKYGNPVSVWINAEVIFKF